jgi:hypothetical protein
MRPYAPSRRGHSPKAFLSHRVCRLVGMELGEYSEDGLDQLLVQAESEIGQWRAVQMAVVAEKKRRRSHLDDGFRSIIDWTAAITSPSTGKGSRSNGPEPPESG